MKRQKERVKKEREGSREKGMREWKEQDREGN